MADKKKPGMEGKKEEPKPKRTFSLRPHLLSWAVFIPTLVVVFITLISAVFPALVIRTTSTFNAQVYSANIINPFEPGIFAVPLVVVNVIVLAIGIMYYKRSKCKDVISKVRSFEISKKQAIIGVIAILVIFCAITAGTLAKEETWADYADVKSRVQSWNISQFDKSFEPHFRYLLLSTSLNGLGNIRIIPFILSAALLVQTYLFTKKITGKRISGIVSMVLLLQSDIFVSYSTTASYENSWILLYLFSLYLVTRFWPPSPAPYVLSLFSKPLTLAFFPMSVYFIVRSDLPRRTKIYSLLSYGVIWAIVAAVVASFSTNLVGTGIYFGASEFWQGFAAMVMQMRFDYVIVLFLLPLIVMLFFASRRGVMHADSIMFFMLVILMAAPLLTGFTYQTNEPYRFVSVSVFFAVGVGVLLSNMTRKERQLPTT